MASADDESANRECDNATTSPSRRRGLSFWIGLALIAASFGIYPAYPVIALLPIPADERVAGAVVGSVVSWSIFALGTTLAGREGIAYLKRLISGRGVPPP